MSGLYMMSALNALIAEIRYQAAQHQIIIENAKMKITQLMFIEMVLIVLDMKSNIIAS
jgi:hypothetical protein